MATKSELEARVAELEAQAVETADPNHAVLNARIVDLETQLAALTGPGHVPQPYPRMVYSGNGTLIVADETEHDAAKAEGYRDAPLGDA